MRDGNGPASTGELVERALRHTDADDARWEAVNALHRRGTADVLEAALGLCRAGDADRRRLGADILARLGSPAQPYRAESWPVLLRMLREERDPGVLNAVTIALGHLGVGAAMQPMADLRHHPAPEVRFAVAAALPSVMAEDGGEVGVAALVDLTSDRESDVRDWATFGLGSLLEADSPAVREALRRRLDDPHDDVRAEALVGLSRRHDGRARERLLAELRRRPVHPLAVEAAEYLGDPGALPLLLELRGAWDIPADPLERAIRCCDRERQAHRREVEARIACLVARAITAGVGGRRLVGAPVAVEPSGADSWLVVGRLRWDLNEALDGCGGDPDRAAASIVSDLARV